VELIDVRDDR
jgi:hypothetical protein